MAQQSHSVHVAQHPIRDIDPYTPLSSNFTALSARIARSVQSSRQENSHDEAGLRQRMIDDMKIRNMSPNTQYIYTRAVQPSAPSTSNLRLVSTSR